MTTPETSLGSRRRTSLNLCLFPLLVGFWWALAACSTDAGNVPGSRSGSSSGTGRNNLGSQPSNGNSPQPGSAVAGSSGGFVIPSGGANNTAPSIGTGMDGTCASGMQSTTPVTPTVWLVIDGSSSMNQDFENGNSRWLALRSTLMDPGGVVDSLQSIVRFGMVIYAGGDGANCVQLVTANPALDNLATLSAMYPMQPLAMGTPTDKALEHVVNNLPVLNMGTLDGNSGPVYVVLATDGSPNDNCGGGGIFGGGGGGNVEQKVVDVTAEGTSNGMQMFVISLAGDDDRLQSHLATVAMATKSQTPPFVPATQNELISAFQMIVGGASCLVSLNGSVETGKECAGTVSLNSQVLRCNENDGWTLFNPSTVQLVGAACQTFTEQQSMVIAKFPCDVFNPD